MKTSNKGVMFLAANEGIVPAPYLDSVGVWTVGIGHTEMAGAPDPSAMSTAMPDNLQLAAFACAILFGRDLQPYEDTVNAAFTVPLTQREFDAAVSFHYNTGAIATATWVKTMNGGDKELAAEQIMNWSKPPEIIPRRQKEQALFRDGVYSEDAATVWGTNGAGEVIWTAVATIPFQQGVQALTLAGRTPS